MKLQTIDPRTQHPVGDVLVESSHAEIDEAVSQSTHAFESWSITTGDERAAYLEALALGLEAHRDELVKLADLESALGLPRLNGELDRTCFQLRRFANLAKSGAPFQFTDDPAVAGGTPVGHPAIMKVRIPLGPVAVFAASNFPFAFSDKFLNSRPDLSSFHDVVSGTEPPDYEPKHAYIPAHQIARLNQNLRPQQEADNLHRNH